MLNLIRADLFKLRKSTAIKVCLILSWVAAILLVYISNSIAMGRMSPDILGSASGLGDVMIVFLLGSLLTGVLICTDFESKLIHDAIASGNGRSAVVISKTIMFVLLTALLILPYVVATMVGFGMHGKFTEAFVPSLFLDILYNKAGVAVTAANMGKIAVVSLVAMLVYAAQLSICIPLAFKVRKPIVVMSFGFAVSFLVTLVIDLMKDVPGVSDLMSITPFTMGYKVVNLQADAAILLKAAASSMVFLAIMATITFKLFKKAEIK